MEEVSSGEVGGAHCVEFYQRAARLLCHRVLGRMGGLADKMRIFCCAAGTCRFDAHRPYQLSYNKKRA